MVFRYVAPPQRQGLHEPWHRCMQVIIKYSIGTLIKGDPNTISNPPLNELSDTCTYHNDGASLREERRLFQKCRESFVITMHAALSVGAARFSYIRYMASHMP